MSEHLANRLHGILLIVLFSCSACYIAEFEWVKCLSLSPLIIGIVLGMVYANILRHRLPKEWVPGIHLCTKLVLRAGIVLYGFRLTFRHIADIGAGALLLDAIIVTTTILLGVLLGRWLKIDRETGLLTSIGSAVCGAAAVLGAESVVKSPPFKTAVSISTVVIFGTLSMFLYPSLFRAGVFSLTSEQMGLFTGATLHEVAHVVGAGNAMGPDIADSAIIVKMIRVMMLAPVLLVLSCILSHFPSDSKTEKKAQKITIPWFAFFFVVVIGLNSLQLLPASYVDGINSFDTFLLTMAMTALGTESGFSQFRKAGPRPFFLAGLLYVWLFFGGYVLVRLFF